MFIMEEVTRVLESIAKEVENVHLIFYTLNDDVWIRRYYYFSIRSRYSLIWF